MRLRFVIAVAFGILFSTACSGQQSVPNGSSYADSAAATRRVDPSLSNVGPATARWGVEGSGSFGAGAASNFDFCNGVLNPPGGCADPPIEYGVKSFSEGDSGASSTCDVNSSKGADCSSAVSVKPALGTIEESLSLRVSGLSKDGNYAASLAAAAVSSNVIDYVTPTSKTLHKGTAVQFKVTETLSGSFDVPCGDLVPSLTDSVSAYGLYASVVGICSNGAFVFTTGSGAQGQTDTETVTLAIGTPVAIAQDLELSGTLDDCSGGQELCPPGQPGSPYYLGPVSETFSNVKAVLQIDPITPGVSYTTASGHSYR